MIVTRSDIEVLAAAPIFHVICFLRITTSRGYKTVRPESPFRHPGNSCLLTRVISRLIFSLPVDILLFDMNLTYLYIQGERLTFGMEFSSYVGFLGLKNIGAGSHALFLTFGSRKSFIHAVN